MPIEVRKGQGDVKLTRDEFERRLRERFYDPGFQDVERQIADIVDVAWKAYDEYRKSPRTRKAGPGFAHPEFELPIEWLETRERIQQAEREQKDTSRLGGCCWCPVRPVTIRRARARCRRRSAWRHRRARKSSARASTATSSTSVCSRRNTAARFFPARPASLRRCRSVTGRAPAIPITRWARWSTG